jgi:hypothetical protein
MSDNEQRIEPLNDGELKWLDTNVALSRSFVKGADPKLENNHSVSPLGLATTIANYDVKQHFADVET